MTNTNWIERAIRESEPQDLRSREVLENRLNALSKQRSQCLPVENDLKERLDTEISQVQDELIMVDTLDKETIIKYKRIDLSIPLSWTQRHPHAPRLVPFRLDSSTTKFTSMRANIDLDFSFTAIFAIFGAMSLIASIASVISDGFISTFTIGSFLSAILLAFIGYYLFASFNLISRLRIKKNAGMKPKFPDAISKNFEQFTKRELKESYTRIDTLTCHFSGAIPSETKAKINEAKETFGKHIYLIAEPSRIDSQVRITDPDPLVIGVKGNLTYLIDVFDLTPLEEAVVAEFTE